MTDSLPTRSATQELYIRDIVATVGFLYGALLPDSLTERFADLPDGDVVRISELIALRRAHAAATEVDSAES